MKKHDLPAMPFYIGDWLKCPELRACSPAARGLWIDMLCFMWESTERGYLTLNNKPIPNENLARMTGFARDLLGVLLDELESFAVFSRREDGAIYSRKMVKDEKIRKLRAENGQKGGFAKHFAIAKPLAKSWQNTENENESEDESEDENKSSIQHNTTTHPKSKYKNNIPTLEEVKEYCLERNNGIEPQTFIDYYEARGWKFKTGHPVKSWKACVRTWENRRKQPVDMLTDVQKRNIAKFNDWKKRQEAGDDTINI